MVLIAFVPFLEVILAVLGFMLGYFLFQILQPTLRAAFGAIPVVGNDVAGLLGTIIGNAQTTAQNNLDAITGPLAAFLSNVTNGAVTFVNAIAQGLDAGIVAAIQVARVAVSFEAFVGQTFSRLQGQVSQALALLASLPGRIVALEQAAADLATRVIPGTERLAVAQAEAFTRGAIDSTETTLGHAIDGVRGQLADAERAIEADLHAGDTAVRKAAADALAGLRTDLGPLVNPAEVAKVIGLVTAVPLVQTAIRDLERECAPNCNFWSPGIDAMSALISAGTLAAIFALVAEAEHDPAGAARTVEGLVSPAIAGARALLPH